MEGVKEFITFIVRGVGMKKIVVEEYNGKHQSDIIDLILEIQQKEFNVPITREDQPDLEDIPNFYQSGDGNFWTALHNREVVGTVSLKDIGMHRAALRKMFVREAFRGPEYGTAKLLLQHLIEWSEKRGITDIYLGTTEKFLAAHRFYEKNGFVRIDKESLPESFPVVTVDTRFYKKRL